MVAYRSESRATVLATGVSDVAVITRRLSAPDLGCRGATRLPCSPWPPVSSPLQPEDRPRARSALPPRIPWISRTQEVWIRAPTSGARRSCTPAAAARTSGEQSSTAPLPPPPRAASPAPSPSAHLQPPVERKEERMEEGRKWLGFSGGGGAPTLRF
ncbi:hypothetical protein PVAP13_8KG275801 [Panicum virgatum]|uniref:Uncharacterized protein n=1 Tax=Panicum virgatum TaxID=38727 RepID=A0A8T0PKJ0_PANVG|nr:hypothetical protein PVAP13_8KG275801 [Panicum virgatum]